MRIVALADTHLFHEDLGELPDGDVLVHAGDACRAGTLEELAHAVAFLKALPHRHKLFVAGNHEVALERSPAAARALFGDEVRYLEDDGVELDGVRFWGSPWTPRFHDWAFMRERGTSIAERWAQIPSDTHVLVTHGPPLGFGDAAADGRGLGCADLLNRTLEVRPLLHLFGHIHQGRGSWRSGETTFANVTTWECELPPTVIDVDVAAREVRVVRPSFWNGG